MKMQMPFVLLFMLVPFFVNAGGNSLSTYSAKAAIQYNGASSLHAFNGSAEPGAFIVHVDPTSEDKTFMTLDVVVPVSSMNSGNKKRDRKMLKMLDAGGFPSLIGHIERAEIKPLSSAEESQLIPLSIVIRNATNEVSAIMTEWASSVDELTFGLNFNLSLKAFDLHPPRLPFIKVSDTVTVSIQVQGEPEAK